MVFCHLPYGPFILSMLIFVVRDIGFLCKRCAYFSGFCFAIISGLYLSFPLPRCGRLYWVEIFQNGVDLCPLLRLSCFTSMSLWGVYCVKESSAAPYVTPLPVHRMRLHSVLKCGSIAEGFRFVDTSIDQMVSIDFHAVYFFKIF